MEYYENGLLEELLALRSEYTLSSSWDTNIISGDNFCYNYYPNNNNVCNIINNNNNLDYFVGDENQAIPIFTPPCSTTTTASSTTTTTSSAFDNDFYPNNNNFLPFYPFTEFNTNQLTELPIFDEEICKTEPVVEKEFVFSVKEFRNCPNLSLNENTEFGNSCTRAGYECGGADVAVPGGGFSVGLVGPPEKKGKSKKVAGQPSKNLMAERRRRKRLNDRLSMLRSIVPKISKMDRTSILGDTIDYMKELLEKINHLQEEMDVGPDQLRFMSIFKDVKPDEISVRNSPKFDVERRGDSDTRVDICCSAKPGLLLSTVTTLEALGLEIQQCVISCFNDFALRASCTTEELEQRELLNSEDIKQALFRNAGYGGKCI